MVAQLVKKPPANAGDMGSIPGLGRSPGEGNGNPLQYSAWEIPWTEEPGRLQSMGLQKSYTTLWANHQPSYVYINGGVYVWQRICFKKHSHTIMGAGKFELCKAGCDQYHPQEKEMQKGKMVVWGGLRNSLASCCECRFLQEASSETPDLDTHLLLSWHFPTIHSISRFQEVNIWNIFGLGRQFHYRSGWN